MRVRSRAADEFTQRTPLLLSSPLRLFILNSGEEVEVGVVKSERCDRAIEARVCYSPTSHHSPGRTTPTRLLAQPPSPLFRMNRRKREGTECGASSKGAPSPDSAHQTNFSKSINDQSPIRERFPPPPSFRKPRDN
jgi:hypothetical protein